MKAAPVGAAEGEKEGGKLSPGTGIGTGGALLDGVGAQVSEAGAGAGVVSEVFITLVL